MYIISNAMYHFDFYFVFSYLNGKTLEIKLSVCKIFLFENEILDFIYCFQK